MRLFLRGLKEGMYGFGEIISLLFNTILLFIIYCFVLGPTAIIAKVVGKRFLQKKNSGWQNINEKELKNESFYRQF